MTAPLVSVLVCAYQHVHWVEQALESVLAQRADFAVEVLVGDDGSTDGTRERIAAVSAGHPGRLQTMFPKHRPGHEGKALFVAMLARSRGRYVAWLDADDHWTDSSKLARQVAHLEDNPDTALCFHNAIRLTGDGGEAPYNRWRRRIRLHAPDLLRRNPIAAVSPMFRREAILPVPDWYLQCPWGDWPLYVLAAQRGPVDYLPDVMGVYRLHPGGMFTGMTRLEQWRRHEHFYALVSRELDGTAKGRARRMLAAARALQALEHARSGEPAAAAKLLRSALRANPGGLAEAAAIEFREAATRLSGPLRRARRSDG